MLELILIIAFCWLFFKALGLAFRVAWGTTKFVASALLTIAVPLLFLCMVFAGGLILLVPLLLIALAFGLLKACIG